MQPELRQLLYCFSRDTGRRLSSIPDRERRAMRPILSVLLAACVTSAALCISQPLQAQDEPAQEAPAFKGLRLGSNQADLELEHCATPPMSSSHPEDKEVTRCLASDSVAVYLADGELFTVMFMKHVDLTPAEHWQETRDWATHTFGEPDTVVVVGSSVNIFWRATEARPWHLAMNLMSWSGTRIIVEYIDCGRARPGYCQAEWERLWRDR